MHHEDAIRRCLELAERGRFFVGNGAMVGAVLVRGGTIIAEGYHEAFGKPHAERQLLEKFEQKIDSNDILYVNLEPCVAHKSKKNPPCCDIIIKKGVKRVVYGMRDPDPRVAGKGIKALKKAGIEVIGPVLPEVCARFNRGFVTVRTKGRPWIVMQQARTPGGEFAAPDGGFLKITTKEQDTWTHGQLRAKNDAVLIGIGTALMDNPTLTIRHVKAAYQPWRIVIDSRLRLPIQAKLVSDEYASKTILVVKPKLNDVQRSVIPILKARGVRILEVKHTVDGIHLPSLWKVLLEPDGDYHGITSILFEGGQRMWKVFMGAGCVDEQAIMVGTPAPGSETRKRLDAAH